MYPIKNNCHIVIYLLIVLVIYRHQVLAQDGWPQPRFTDPGTSGIVLEFLQAQDRHGIFMNEEIPWDPPFKLVTINYNGTGIPEISQFIGNPEHLQTIIQSVNGEWGVYVRNRQDYENPGQVKVHTIHIRIANDPLVSTTGIFIVSMQNIFDNAPVITYDGPCEAPELAADYKTNCTITVFHPDGTMGNPFRLEIDGKHEEWNLFHFSEPFEVNDGYSREYTLYVTKELKFEQRAMYSFQTHVYDDAGNTSRITTVLQVLDMPSLDPQWIWPFTTARFKEKQSQIFQVNAIDGDTDIDKEIMYELAFLPNQDYSKLISINPITGQMDVIAIDRDTLKQEVFPFSVIAYKFDNRTWAVNGDAVIIVDDINDKEPIVTISPIEISILENTYLSLPLNSFWVIDEDLGEHATYQLELISSDETLTYAQPFTVIPNKGYQESNFTLTISDTSLLDYEVTEWQNIKIKIVATEDFNASHVGEFEITIKLLNWNDELPIFSEQIYETSILETTEGGHDLLQVRAIDRDIDDFVTHGIVGITDLGINTVTGMVSTIVDNTFDYERQTMVIVQIQATDELQTIGERTHSTFAQLVINVIDVNDETPEIRMPRAAPKIFENPENHTLVTHEGGIIATDPDTTAELVFTIHWDLSYATKAGQEAPKTLYENCFYIDPDTTDPNRVIGQLKVNPDFYPWLVDYEEYEVIYLIISVTDLQQEVNNGTAEGVLTVRIEDLNDNYPLFILDTLETPRSVVEEAIPGTTVGTIFAHDIDGPQYNQITYSMSPIDGTPDGWLQINGTNGVITVMENANIDCDIPVKIFHLSYMVLLNDTQLTTPGRIDILVIDINNKVPTFDVFETNIYLYENITDGQFIQQVKTSDLDRDSPHNLVQHLLNLRAFPNLGRYFTIDIESGVIEAQLEGLTVFDRDRGDPFHDIHIDVEDNYQQSGRKNANNIMVKLILLDVNDNKPEMPKPETFQPRISENSQPGLLLGTILVIDVDDELTPNAQVGYGILLPILPGPGTATLPPPNAHNLFEIDEVTGDLRLKSDPRSYYGTWYITIEAYDHGHLWTSNIQLKSNETYEIIIEPFNFNAPTLISPTSGKQYRLSFDGQAVGEPLLLAEGTILPPFEAIDEDGGIFGQLTYEITNYLQESNDAEYFDLIKINDKSTQMLLRRPIVAKFYRLNIRTIDGGGRTSDWATNVAFVFVDMTGEPVFNIPVFHTDFTENSTGLVEVRRIPAAEDPKNVGIEDESLWIDIYYFIDVSYHPADAILFDLSAETGDITLRQQLDRESIDNHEFRVIATNLRNGPTTNNIQDASYLIVKVSVNDVNDNPPTFDSKNYGAGITDTDPIGKIILHVHATDPDLDDIIRYVIKPNTYRATGTNLDGILTEPFTLDSATGALTLNFGVASDMQGYIEFEIQAFDLVDHDDTCYVKIFLISDSSRVTFVFLNDKPTVDNHTTEVATILNNFYDYDECNIDDVVKAETNGVAQDTITNVRAHFIKNNEAIEASEILARSNDVVFIMELRSALLGVTINLMDVPATNGHEDLSNMQQILEILLIVITTILCIILIGVIITYFIKTRSLNRQLRALSAPNFSTIDSKLNRMELPTSNVFSVEGSNPVLNNEKLDKKNMFDNMSINSDGTDDSDFIGIDNDPTFMPHGNITGANIAVINGLSKRSSPTNIDDKDKESNDDNTLMIENGVYKF